MDAKATLESFLEDRRVPSSEQLHAWATLEDKVLRQGSALAEPLGGHKRVFATGVLEALMRSFAACDIDCQGVPDEPWTSGSHKVFNLTSIALSVLDAHIMQEPTHGSADSFKALVTAAGTVTLKMDCCMVPTEGFVDLAWETWGWCSPSMQPHFSDGLPDAGAPGCFKAAVSRMEFSVLGTLRSLTPVSTWMEAIFARAKALNGILGTMRHPGFFAHSWQLSLGLARRIIEQRPASIDFLPRIQAAGAVGLCLSWLGFLKGGSEQPPILAIFLAAMDMNVKQLMKARDLAGNVVNLVHQQAAAAAVMWQVRMADFLAEGADRPPAVLTAVPPAAPAEEEVAGSPAPILNVRVDGLGFESQLTEVQLAQRCQTVSAQRDLDGKQLAGMTGVCLRVDLAEGPDESFPEAVGQQNVCGKAAMYEL